MTHTYVHTHTDTCHVHTPRAPHTQHTAYTHTTHMHTPCTPHAHAMHTQRVILSSLAAAVRDSPAGCAALVALNQPHHLPAFDRVVHLEHG